MSRGTSDPPQRPQPRTLLLLAAAHDAIGAATLAMSLETRALELELGDFASSLGALADGDASVIHSAGLTPRERTPLDTPPMVSGTPGKRPGEAILTWPCDPRASGYALAVSFTPGGPWTAMLPGTTCSRLVKAPAPASILLARVAAIDRDGALGDWSAPALVATR